MKKFIIALVAMFMMTFTSASAMSYEQARQQALFTTDKMAYELNLTDDQYEAAYEVNLDYLMGVDTYDDLYGIYWRQRNLDLSYILRISSIAHSVPQAISTVLFTGMVDTSTSASMHATHAEITSSSEDLISMLYIVVDTAGE